MLASLVLFQPHRHSSFSSSASSLYSYRSFSNPRPFLSRSRSRFLEPLSAFFAPLRLSSLTAPLPAYSRPWSLPAARTLCSLSPRPRGNAPLKNVDPSSLRLASCSVGERTLTSSSRPVPPRHCLLRLVLLLLFLPLLTPPGINQPRRVPFRSRPSSKHLDKFCVKKLIGGHRKRACAPKRCTRRTNQRILEVRRRINYQKKLPRRRVILIFCAIYVDSILNFQVCIKII